MFSKLRFKAERFIKRNAKCAISITTFLVILTCLPFALWHLSKTSCLMSIMDYFGPGNILVYFGTILAGLITFIGVLLTIRFYKKQSWEEEIKKKYENIRYCSYKIKNINDNVQTARNLYIKEIRIADDIISKSEYEDLEKRIILLENLKKEDLLTLQKYIRKAKNLEIHKERALNSEGGFEFYREGNYILLLTEMDEMYNKSECCEDACVRDILAGMDAFAIWCKDEL